MIHPRVLTGINIVLTGEFNSFGVSREELSGFLSEIGASVQRTIYNNTNYLVYGTTHGMGIFHSSVTTHPKYKKAESKGTKTISYPELEQIVKTRLKDISFSISNFLNARKEEQRRIQLEKKKQFEQMEIDRKRIFYENSELMFDYTIKTPSLKSNNEDFRRDIIDRWANRSAKMGKLFRDKIINERRRLDEINEVNWNVENVDWGQPDPQGRLFICYGREWYNKRKEENEFEDKIFTTRRQALIYCCKKNFDCLSEDAKEPGQIFDYEQVLRMSDKELGNYLQKLEEQMESEHEGKEYYYKIQEIKNPTNIADLYQEVSGIKDRKKIEEYDKYKRMREFKIL